MDQFIPTLFDSIAQSAAAGGAKIVVALLILLIGFRIVKIFCKKLDKVSDKNQLPPTVSSFFHSCLKFLLYAVVLISAALVLGVPSASFIAILSSAGLAVGLALQGSLSNFAGSVMLLLFRPYGVGDYVTVNGVSGRVESINLFYTVIQTIDHKRTTLPNGSASNSVAAVADYSGLEIRRLDLNLTGAAGTDAEAMRALLSSIASGKETILSDPAPVVIADVQEDTSVKFTLRIWCKGEDYWKNYYELTQEISIAAAKHGIVLPFPQNEAI